MAYPLWSDPYLALAWCAIARPIKSGLPCRLPDCILPLSFPSRVRPVRSPTGPTSSETILHLVPLREEQQDDGGSSADDGAPRKSTSWVGMGEPMMVGTGCTAREFCDGQTLASPGSLAR